MARVETLFYENHRVTSSEIKMVTERLEDPNKAEVRRNIDSRPKITFQEQGQSNPGSVLRATQNIALAMAAMLKPTHTTS